MRPLSFEQKGTSLLEVVVALGILIVALFALVNLSIRAFSVRDASGHLLVASELAREGIEVARNRRDSNWLANQKFGDGLLTEVDQTAVPVFSAEENTWSFDFFPDEIAEAPVYFLHGMYLQGEQASRAGAQTEYFRLVSFEPVSGHDADESGIRVRSRVSWNERGSMKQIYLEEWLYDWR